MGFSLRGKEDSFMFGELHILLILTGGTIGTMVGEDGKRRLPEFGEGAEPMLLRRLREQEPEIRFFAEIRTPYEVLSEHMTLGHLEKLAKCLRGEDLTKYDGVFITHGSDTLAFTAAFLGVLMRGCPVPVFLLAAQRPLEDPESNGVENARAALRLMETWEEYRRGSECEFTPCFMDDMQGDGIKSVSGLRNSGLSPVYVPYRNSDGMYLHRAEELRQCQPGTDDFFSGGMQSLKKSSDGRYVWPQELDGKKQQKLNEETRSGLDEQLPQEATRDGDTVQGSWLVPDISLAPDVLILHPYVGIRYDCISLEGIRAVVHTMYHSSTAPKELVRFLDRCREAGVPCYILPCDPENFHYETTAELLEHGAIPIGGMSVESAYMRLVMNRLPE